ncbi:hypothetical protein DWV16_17640, partial [Anaerotruncus sp. AF02-27]
MYSVHNKFRHSGRGKVKRAGFVGKFRKRRPIFKFFCKKVLTALAKCGIITKLSREDGEHSTLKNEQREKRTEACRLALGAGLWAEVTL